jgi:hypothetical protein
MSEMKKREGTGEQFNQKLIIEVGAQEGKERKFKVKLGG